jgi:hypothetical protein
MTGLTCTGALIHALYLDLHYSADLILNPSSSIIILALGVHIIGTLVLFGGCICIRDSSVYLHFGKHPIMSVILVFALLI